MRIDIREAVPGMILEVPIIRDDVLLVKKGGELTSSLINRLKGFGITSIDIVSEKKDNSHRNNVEFTIGDELFDSVREALLENDIEKIESSANEMVRSVLYDFDIEKGFANFKYNLESYYDGDDTIAHSIRTATFSIVLAHVYNKNLNKVKDNGDQKVDLQEVAVAALLNEKARNYYDHSVLEMVKKLADNEKLRRILPGIVDVPVDKFDDKYIPLYSYCLVNSAIDIPFDIKNMILYSSEMENNQGPLKAIGFDKTNTEGFVIGAKMIHLCSLYDSYLAHSVYNKESLENTVTVIGHAASHGVINEELANLFINNVPVYSMGNIVELSTGEKAMVKEAFVGYKDTTRPLVQVIPNGRFIDLRDENMITIKGICNDVSSFDDIVNGQLSEVDRRVRR